MRQLFAPFSAYGFQFCASLSIMYISTFTYHSGHGLHDSVLGTLVFYEPFFVVVVSDIYVCLARLQTSVILSQQSILD